MSTIRNKARSFVTPIGTFDTQLLAANALGIAHATIRVRARKYPSEYYFLELPKQPSIKKVKKVYVTPKGRFNSLVEAHIVLNISRQTLVDYGKRYPNDYYFERDGVRLASAAKTGLTQGEKYAIRNSDPAVKKTKSIKRYFITPFGRFYKIRDAAIAHGITYDALRRQKDLYPELYYFED